MQVSASHQRILDVQAALPQRNRALPPASTHNEPASAEQQHCSVSTAVQHMDIGTMAAFEVQIIDLTLHSSLDA